MLSCQIQAIKYIRENALYRQKDASNYLNVICNEWGITKQQLVASVLQSCVTLNFHPDRYASNGQTVLTSLIQTGKYQGLFETGVTNGSRSAFIGGERFIWEQRLFQEAYSEASLERPKYGALNILNYRDGASMRFGSCFFVLKQHVLSRCTFSYGDSALNPTTLCTSDTFDEMIVALLHDVDKYGRLLNRPLGHQQEALALLMHPKDVLKDIGKNLDYCIEVQAHGDIHLATDVESFYVDSSFRGSEVETQADILRQVYGIAIEWIPARELPVNSVGCLFRGPMIPTLAQKIDRTYGQGQGLLNAYLIGCASRASKEHPEMFKDLGTEEMMFQSLKQLWHTIGYFG